MSKKLLIKGTLVDSTSNPLGGEVLIDLSQEEASATTMSVVTDSGVVEFGPNTKFNIGDSTHPVYFKDGVPVEVDGEMGKSTDIKTYNVVAGSNVTVSTGETDNVVTYTINGPEPGEGADGNTVTTVTGSTYIGVTDNDSTANHAYAITLNTDVKLPEAMMPDSVTSAVTSSHTHSNKNILDTIDQDKINSWDAGDANVQADWSVTATTSDAYIKNKPTIPTSLSQITSAHTHSLTDVTGLQTALSGKSNTGHTHSLSDLTDSGSVVTTTYLTNNKYLKEGDSISIDNVTNLSTTLASKADKSDIKEYQFIEGDNITIVTGTTDGKTTVTITGPEPGEGADGDTKTTITTGNTFVSAPDTGTGGNHAYTISINTGKSETTVARGDHTHDGTYIKVGDAEKNQNAFSVVKFGTTSIEADSATDTLNLVAGDNISFSANTTSDTLRIDATNTDTNTITSVVSGDSFISVTSAQTGDNRTYTISANTGTGSTQLAVGNHNHDGRYIGSGDTRITQWNTAYTNSSGLTNASVLSGIQDSDITNWNGKVSSIEMTGGGSVTVTPTVTAGNKYSFIISGATEGQTTGEDNQNAFSYVKAGSNMLTADSTMDTLEIVSVNNGVVISGSDTNNQDVVSIGLNVDNLATQLKDKVENSSYVTNTELSNVSILSAITQNKIDSWDAAEANVQADWSVTATTSGAYIKNKPTIPTSLSDITSAHTHSDYVNQNAFSVVKVNNVTLSADEATDTLSITGGSYISLNTTANTDTMSIDVNTTNLVSGISGSVWSAISGNVNNNYSTTGHNHDSSYVKLNDSDYKNQNTFSNVVVGSTTLAADKTGDTLSVVAGDYISLSGNATSDSFKISVTGLAASDHTHPGYENQNAFSKVSVSGVTLEADNSGDTLSVVGGDYISLSGNANTDTFAISVTGVSASGHKHVISDVDNLETALNEKVSSGTLKTVNNIALTSTTGGNISINNWNTGFTTSGNNIKVSADASSNLYVGLDDYATSLSGSYVMKSGDTMTGNLVVSGSSRFANQSIYSQLSRSSATFNGMGVNPLAEADYQGDQGDQEIYHTTTLGYGSFTSNYAFIVNGSSLNDILGGNAMPISAGTYISISSGSSSSSKGTIDLNTGTTLPTTMIPSLSGSYLPLSGGTVKGNVSVSGSNGSIAFDNSWNRIQIAGEVTSDSVSTSFMQEDSFIIGTFFSDGTSMGVALTPSGLTTSSTTSTSFSVNSGTSDQLLDGTLQPVNLDEDVFTWTGTDSDTLSLKSSLSGITVYNEQSAATNNVTAIRFASRGNAYVTTSMTNNILTVSIPDNYGTGTINNYYNGFTIGTGTTSASTSVSVTSQGQHIQVSGGTGIDVSTASGGPVSVALNATQAWQSLSGNVSSNYLPLSGGAMSGNVSMSESYTYTFGASGSVRTDVDAGGVYLYDDGDDSTLVISLDSYNGEISAKGFTVWNVNRSSIFYVTSNDTYGKLKTDSNFVTNRSSYDDILGGNMYPISAGTFINITSGSSGSSGVSKGTINVNTGTSSTTVARGDHGHNASSITGGTLSINRIPTGTSSTTVALGNHTHTGYASSSHTHTGYASSSHTHDYLPLSGGTMTGTIFTSSGIDFDASAIGEKTIHTYNGNLTIIDTTGTIVLDGDVSITSSISATSFYESSDIKLKENINEITTDVEKSKNVEFKEYNLISDESKTKKYGVIAQEVEEAGLSNLVAESKDGTKSVDYIALLCLKMQEMQDEIKSLKERINELEGK